MSAFVVAAVLGWGQVAPFMGPTTLEAVVEQIAVEMEVEIAVPRFLKNRLIYVNFNGGTTEELRDGLFECLDLYLTRKRDGEYDLRRKSNGLPSVHTVKEMQSAHWDIYERAAESLPVNATREQVRSAAQKMYGEFKLLLNSSAFGGFEVDDSLVQAFVGQLSQEMRLSLLTIRALGADLTDGFGQTPTATQMPYLTRRSHPVLYEAIMSQASVVKRIQRGRYGTDPVIVFTHGHATFASAWRPNLVYLTAAEGADLRYNSMFLSTLRLLGPVEASAPKVDLTETGDLFTRMVDTGLVPMERPDQPSVEILPQIMKNLGVNFAAFLPQTSVAWQGNMRRVSLRYLEGHVFSQLPFSFLLTESGWVRAGSSDLLPLTNDVEWEPHMPAVVKNDRNELFTVDEFVAYLDGLDTASARQALHIRYQHPSLTTGANETFDGVPLFYLARDTLRDWNGEDLSWTVTQGEGPPGFRELTYAMISEGHRYWLNPSQYVRYRELGLKSNVRYSIKTDGDEIVFEAMVVQRPKLDTRRVPVKVVLTLEES